MPIYEYRCEDCGEKLEKLQRMSDPHLRDCPACGEAALKRLVSAAGFRLKGGGWYETDFKQANQRNLADSGKGEKSDQGGKDEKGGKSASGDAASGKGGDGSSKPSKDGKSDTGKNKAPAGKNQATPKASA